MSQLLLKGLADLEAGHTATPEALLVAMAPTKLAGLGVALPESVWEVVEPELTLYRVLQQTHEDPYNAYNALRERFFKLEYTLEARVHRRARKDGVDPGEVVLRTQPG